MIAKGLDFPNATLVGILNADTALNLDFALQNELSAADSCGQADRAEKAGQVFIQSYSPHHYTRLSFARKQDMKGYRL